MAEALWALGSASALRAWVGLSRPAVSLDGINKRIKIFLLVEREEMAVPASRQAPLTSSWKLSSYGARLAAGLVKMEWAHCCSESRARSCFPEVAPKQLVALRRRFVQRSGFAPPPSEAVRLNLGRTRFPRICCRFRSCLKSSGP